MTIHRVPTAGAVGEGYPKGHLGHLTPEEEKAFQDFKAFVQEKGLYRPGPPPSHADSTLLCVALAVDPAPDFRRSRSKKPTLIC